MRCLHTRLTGRNSWSLSISIIWPRSMSFLSRVLRFRNRLVISGLLCRFCSAHDHHLYRVLDTELYDHILQCLEVHVARYSANSRSTPRTALLPCPSLFSSCYCQIYVIKSANSFQNYFSSCIELCAGSEMQNVEKKV